MIHVKIIQIVHSNTLRFANSKTAAGTLSMQVCSLEQSNFYRHPITDQTIVLKPNLIHVNSVNRHINKKMKNRRPKC